MDKLHAGIDEYLSGDLHKAVTLLTEHIDENGYDIAAAYYHIGLCYSDLNQMTPACQNFAKAAEIALINQCIFINSGFHISALWLLTRLLLPLKKQ